MSYHAWFSVKCKVACSEMDIQSEIPIYLDSDGNHVEVSFVTKTEFLDYECTWDDLEYRGKVVKWSK